MKDLINSMKHFNLEEPDALDIYQKMKQAHTISKDKKIKNPTLPKKLNQAGRLFLELTLEPKDRKKAHDFKQKIAEIKSDAAKGAKKWTINKLCSLIKYKLKSLLDKINFRGKHNRASKYQARKVLEYSSKAAILTFFRNKKGKKVDSPKQKTSIKKPHK